MAWPPPDGDPPPTRSAPRSSCAAPISGTACSSTRSPPPPRGGGLRAEPTGSEPGWYAEFGELVPAEVLAALTDALVAPAPAEPANPLPALEAAGWLIDGRGAAVSHPPGCRVERRPEKGDGTVPWREPDRTSWHIEVRDHPGPSAAGPRIWHAWFDGNTPEHLVTAFIITLADRAPLQRGMYDRTAHGAVQKPSPLTPEQVVEAHAARLAGIRRQARGVRRQPEAVTPPAKENTTRSTARR